MKKHSSLIRFILLVFVSGCIGAGLSVLVLLGKDAVVQGWDSVNLWFYRWYLPIQVVAGVGFSLWIAGLCRKAKRISDDLENETAFEEANGLLDRAEILTSICTALSLTSFGVFSAQILRSSQPQQALAGVAAFVVVMMLMVYWQVKAVRIIKSLNPEKRGDPLEARFEKDWLGSCDEAERYVIYNASYKTFQVMRYALLLGWLMAVLGGLFLNAGGLPALLVGILYAVQVVAYQINCTRISKERFGD